MAVQAQKLTDQIGKKVTVYEEMTIIYSVLLSGNSLTAPLTLEYLRGKDLDVIVRMTRLHEEPKCWGYMAIFNGDFSSDALNGLPTFAEAAIDDDKPVLVLRQVTIAHAANVLPVEQPPRFKEQVVHSVVRPN